MEEKEIGLYVHIPFCKSKCLYCDFVSFANSIADLAAPSTSYLSSKSSNVYVYE